MKKIAFLFITTILFTAKVFAGGDDILGIWFNEEKTGKVEIYKVDGKYYGKIIWLKEPKDANGNEKTDIHNSDVNKRKNKVMGLIMLRGFNYDAEDNNYVDGNIYDPKNGKDYSCKMKLIDKNNLDVRGYVGISLLGRTTKWTRPTK
jgi:uncharacterized protein (DUF2147 family)